MTNAVAADSISARANSGRRTSLRLGAALALLLSMTAALLFPLAGAATAGTYEAAGWTLTQLPNTPHPTLTGYAQVKFTAPFAYTASTLYNGTCADGSGWGGTVDSDDGPNGDTPFGVCGMTPANVTSIEIRLGSWTDPPVITWSLDVPPDPVCADGVLLEGEEWGGWGAGGAWGSGEDGSGPVEEHLKAWYWDPITKAWTAWNGQYAELDAKIEEWVTLGYYQDGGGGSGDLDGFGGYGGGGAWGGNWTLACDTDADDVPDGFIAPEPVDGPMWEPLYPDGAVPITDPPAPDAPAPSGDCDFGITDPSSWLCGLAGLFGNLLDAIRWIIGWLGRLAGFLMDLLVPDPQVLQDKFTDVDTAWDASGPGQLTGGVTDIAAPILTMDENMPATCEGPQFTLPLPQSRSFTMSPLSTCGELTQYILGVVYPLETALIYLGGFFLGLRIVTRPFGMETPGTTQAASA